MWNGAGEPGFDLQAALDRLDDGFTVYDRDLRLVAWNVRFFELMDFPTDYARPGEPFETFLRHNALRGEYGPGDPERQVAERTALARTFVAHSFERERPNGMVIEVRGNPIPGVGFVTIYKDITARRRAEDALKASHDELERRVAERTASLEALNRRLRESEERIRLIADAVPALIGYVDATERYRFVNRRYQEWFGLPPERIIGRKASEVLGEALYAHHAPYLRTALEGRPVAREFPLRTADGRDVYVVATYIPHRSAEGGVLGYFVLAHDVSERREAEAALRLAQKMKAIGQLTGGLAHDFNNLLTIIIGNLAVLQEEAGASSSVQSLISPALDAARRGARLVTRLLGFARQHPLQVRPVAVGRLVADMAELLRQSLGAATEVVFRLEDEAGPVLADPHQLENAILNLAINGRDAMPGGGRLVIEVGHAVLDDDDAARRPDARPGEHVVVAVSDDGAGMPPEVVERAFEPFFTTKEAGRGSGMGLAMVYGFVRQSGGHATIDSRPGAGTTVRLYLPRSPVADEAVAGRPAATEKIGGGRETVLVVEDDAGVRSYAARALRSLGYRVRRATNGPSALRVLARRPEVALVLTDVLMPGGMSGIELAAAAARRHPRVRVLLMSGFTEEAPTENGASLPLLAKPFEREDLARAVREALEGR